MIADWEGKGKGSMVDHEFMLYKNRMDAYNRTFEFINRFIGK